MAEPQPASGGLTDEAALSCCSDPDPSTKVGAEPNSPESRPPLRGAAGPPERAVPGLNQARLGLDDSNSVLEPHPATAAAPPSLDGLEWDGERARGVPTGDQREDPFLSCLKDCDPACFNLFDLGR